MDDFYETLLKNVHDLIEKEDYVEALKLLDEEFSMPYIPKVYEEQLIPLYNRCKSEVNANKVERKYDENDIEALLFGNIDESFQAVELLKASNIRKHMDVIEKYLKEKPHFLIRTLLIECLIEQDIHDEIEMDYDDLDVTFIPSLVEMPQQQDAFNKAVRIVQDYYENDNPSFFMMCMECMIKEMYFKMPFPLGEDEIKPFIYAILLYVYKANNDKDGFKAMIEEKNLANEGGYDLLLYKYDI